RVRRGLLPRAAGGAAPGRGGKRRGAVLDHRRHCRRLGGYHVRYMLLIYGDENALSQPEREHCYQESSQLAHDLQAAGQFLGAAPLHPTSAATRVRVREGKRLVTDGPFAETREQLGGFFMIDAENLDRAM